MFYAETQNDCQKWQKHNFFETKNLTVTDDFAYTPEVKKFKNFVEITLSHTVSKINAFLSLTQKFSKELLENIFWQR